VDIGPGRGDKGGELVFSGPMEELLKKKTGSLTADYLSGRASVPVPETRRPVGLKVLDKPVSSDNLNLQTKKDAYASLFQPSSDSLRDRSSEASGSTVEHAEKLYQGVEGETFGWSRRQKRERLLDDQLAALRVAAEDFSPPGEHIGGGAPQRRGAEPAVSLAATDAGRRERRGCRRR
jgi:hypothetical protein